MLRELRSRIVDSRPTQSGRLAVAIVALAALAAVAPAASDAASIPITPLLGCVDTPPPSDTADAGTLTAYFGYQNTGPAFNLLIGDSNEFFPGLQNEDQPTTFSHGSFPDAFSVQWAPSVIPTLGWALNGTSITAAAGSTPCIAGATGPASRLISSGATLTGLINSRDQATSYHFDWGTTTDYGQSTPCQTVSDTQPQLESTALTGLAPGTTYHYRLVADNDEVATNGADATFTTPAASTAAAADISLTQHAPARTAVGAPFTDTLVVANGGPATATTVKLTDALPAGVMLLGSSDAPGACTGTPAVHCAVGSLASGASLTITLRLRALTVGSVASTAFASADQPDPNVSNNIATSRVTLTPPWLRGRAGRSQLRR